MTFELTSDAWFCRQLGLLPTTTKCLMLKFQLKCRPFRLNTHISILSRAANDPLVFTIMEKAPNSDSRRFHPGEGPSRGLLCACENRWIVCSSYLTPISVSRELMLGAAPYVTTLTTHWSSNEWSKEPPAWAVLTWPLIIKTVENYRLFFIFR